MKKNKSRLLAGIAVFLLVTAVMSTSSFASGDYYENTYNYNMYICRSTLLDYSCRAKLECQESSYILMAEFYAAYNDSYGSHIAHIYDIGRSSVTAYYRSYDPMADFFYAVYDYYIQSDLVYSTYLYN